MDSLLRPPSPTFNREPEVSAAMDAQEAALNQAWAEWDAGYERQSYMNRSRRNSRDSVHSHHSGLYNVAPNAPPPAVVARTGYTGGPFYAPPQGYGDPSGAYYAPPQAYGDLVTMDAPNMSRTGSLGIMDIPPTLPKQGSFNSLPRAASAGSVGSFSSRRGDPRIVQGANGMPMGTPRGLAIGGEYDGMVLPAPLNDDMDGKYPVGNEVGEKDSKDSSLPLEEIAEEHTLPTDVYSLTLIAFDKNHRKRWTAFYTCFCTWVVQALALGFVAWDMMSTIYGKQECCDMTLGAPIQTTLVVRYGQGVALVLALFGDNDVITNEGIVMLEMILSGFFKKYQPGPPNSMELHDWVHRHFRNVAIVSVLKFFIGFGILWAAMVIIVQSTSIIDLFGNFAAIAFVTAFDNVMYAMCIMGYFGKQLKLMAMEVDEYKMTIAHGHSKKMMLIKTILFLAVCVIILGPFSIVTMEQASGDGVCNSLTVSFGAHMHGWTGTYEWNDEEWHDRRVVYKNRADDSYRVGFCQQEKRWVFHRAPNSPCTTRWFARSGQWGNPFDIVKAEGWQTFDQETGIVDAGSKFGIECNRCTKDKHCGTVGLEVRGKCNLDTQKCECEPGWFGPQCEFSPPCQSISNVRFAEFQTKFLPLEHTPGVVTEAHARPVYYSEAEDGDYFHIVLYDGAKWHITNSKMLEKDPVTGEYKDVIRNTVQLHEAMQDFHVWANTDWTYLYTSDQTVAMGPDQVKQWYRRSWRGNLPVDAAMYCDLCNPQSQDPDNCGFGACNPDNRLCTCEEGYRGAKCNIAPVEGRILATRFMSEGVCYTCPEMGRFAFGLESGIQCSALLDYEITWADDSKTQFSTNTDPSQKFAITRKSTSLCDTVIKDATLPTTGRKIFSQKLLIDSTSAIEQNLEPVCEETVPMTLADCTSGVAFSGKKVDWIWMNFYFFLDQKA